MIVRDSPKSKAPSEQPKWPPKSPYEALLSSPSGRKKYERRRGEGSPSPTPRRRPGSRAQIPSDDEDEETLELQLKAIEARLKLKRLQQAKARQGSTDGDNDSIRTSSRPSTSIGIRRPELPRPQSALQVPVSPTREKRVTKDPTSPARVILGIDKGLRAQDVSLKRAASFHARSSTPRDIPGSLSRATSRAGRDFGGDLSTSAPKAKSFSERIAESRSNDRERQEKQARIEKSRSRGFGLNDIGATRDGNNSRAPSSMSSGTIRSTDREMKGRDPVAKNSPLPKTRSLADLKATSTSRPPSTLSARSDNSNAQSNSSFSTKSSSSAFRNTKTSTTSISTTETSSNREGTQTEPSIFESFSGLHLTKRLIPHNSLTRTLDSKSIFTIPQLLKIVKSPHYDPPDMENDYVVLGVIASKSSPLTPKTATRVRSTGDKDEDAPGPDKFMVLRLTDLKWELDLYLFDTGFSQFWKLSVGTVIAVLNPDIMPPRNRDTGKFSLKLTSSEDTVMEIGTARDLGFCKSMRKDGRECGQWIDSRKTEFCDFHIELQVEKSKRGRMEVNTMTGFGKGPGGPAKGKHGMFGGGGQHGRFKDNGLSKNYGRFQDTEIHETYYIAPSSKSAAQLLDDDDAMDRGISRAELHRKRLAEKEKERELARKLGEIGRGAGGDYMKFKGANTSSLPSAGDRKAKDASAASQEKSNALSSAADLLGGRKADDVTLSPVKRKRNTSGKTSEPMGWSGAFKRGLLEPKEKEKDERETSPTKKKARFMLAEKGIREPGRDSLGGLDVGLLAAMDDDDDDGLDII